MTVKQIKNNTGQFLYRALEKLDGEKSKIRLIKYRHAQKLKIIILINLIDV